MALVCLQEHCAMAPLRYVANLEQGYRREEEQGIDYGTDMLELVAEEEMGRNNRALELVLSVPYV